MKFEHVLLLFCSKILLIQSLILLLFCSLYQFALWALALSHKYSWPFQQISRAGKILHAGNFRAGKVLLEMLEKWNFFKVNFDYF